MGLQHSQSSLLPGEGQDRNHTMSRAASWDRAGICKLAALVKQFAPELAASFKVFGHFLRCPMERQCPWNTCRLLKALVLPCFLLKSSKDSSPPKVDVLLPGGDQEENFTRISFLFTAWDSPIITHFLMMALSPVSYNVQVEIYAIPGARLILEINQR